MLEPPYEPPTTKQIDPQPEQSQKKRTVANREDDRTPRTERKYHE
jgi:hypothetical protein